ncbi:MAG: hypothetical protein WA071_26820 [Undibacterium umbellatum]|uniref:hypothetical protein n=1 Tax=Undibacterium umbellatum TaxID=2762300 RepID=UPI003BB5D806
MARLLTTSLLLLLPVLPLSQPAAAAEDLPTATATEEPQSVAVNGIKNPELRSYRNMLAGLDMFESKHHLAPTADNLRFVLKPRLASTSLAGLSLRIANDDISIPVAVAADGSFILPRDQAAADGDAELMLNRARGEFSGMPRVNSANVPANMRRLGDVRLECQVAIAIAKKEFNVLLRAAAAVALGGTDWCLSSRVSYGTFTPFPTDSVSLVSGDKRTVLLSGHRLKYAVLPLADRNWPDDTLVEFQPSPATSIAHFTAQPIYLSGTMNKWDNSLPLTQVDASNFSVDVVLAKGISKFKIVSKDFKMVELGIGDTRANETKGNFAINTGKALAWAGKDVWFEPPQAGKYSFALNVADPDAPVLTITARE